MDESERLIRDFFAAYLSRDKERCTALLSEEFRFTSPYDDAIDKQQWLERCWPGGDGFARFNVERVVGGGEGAFVTYHVTTRDGRTFRNTEYITLKAGRLTSAHVYFGAARKDGRFAPLAH
jgi:ketosteroid isomerase-like protein